MSNMMDSSFLTTPSVASSNPLDTMMDSLRAQIAAEVKADLSADIIDRVIKLVNSSLTSPTINAQVSVPPSTVQVNSTPALVDITNEMNMEDMCASMCRIENLLTQLIAVMKSPMERTVQRDSANLIQSMTERHI